MDKKDHLGLTYSGASGDALADYLRACAAFFCLSGDPITPIDRAIANSPGFVMGHVLKAHISLLGTNAEMQAMSIASHRAAAALPANDRERAHVRALGLLLQNRLWEAARAYEDLSLRWPLDALALQMGQQSDFLVGDSRMLRDRIGRVMPKWSADMPEYHAVLGMAAFGLEETGQYARAEATAREALRLEPRNTWATHALAHVFEMENRRREGAAWMRGNSKHWAEDSFFSIHNWWHLALFHLGLGDIDEVLKLWDGPIYGEPSALQFDMIDASALLWRLHLQGVDVGDRWEVLAGRWAADQGESTNPFTDMHAMMAFAGADHDLAARELLHRQSAAAVDGPGDTPLLLREGGSAATLAIRAFGEGYYADCVELLRPMRNRAHRFGGSHAQRDLLDLTLIEAARRDGQARLVEALEAERGFAKPEHADASVWRRAA